MNAVLYTIIVVIIVLLCSAFLADMLMALTKREERDQAGIKDREDGE